MTVEDSLDTYERILVQIGWIFEDKQNLAPAENHRLLMAFKSCFRPSPVKTFT